MNRKKAKQQSIECPYCHSRILTHIRKITSPVNGKEYTEHICKKCDLQFFTPLIFEKVIYQDELIEEYGTFHEGRKHYPPWTKTILSQLSKMNLNFTDKKILEIGAGDGINFKALKERFKIKPRQYLAIELDPRSITACRRNGIKRIMNVLFDNNIDKIINERFDIILATEVLEHQTKPDGFLLAAFRLLKPDGILIISVPNRDRFFIKYKEIPGDIPPHHFLKFNKTFFLRNFRDELFFCRDYSSSDKNFRDSAKVVNRILLENDRFWLLFIPFIFLFRLLDVIEGEGLIVFIRRSEGIR
ncbi:MAG: methyltransferase domain-containing protein [Nanoarchaeota archaeon]|nr:methyltransferase domain-containing protein [Nanoarchaeota archaeon]